VSPFVGEIRTFAGNFAPAGWAFCDGALIPIDQNPTLFQLIGTTYGGDGQNNFALPDLRGRWPVGVGPGFALGQTGGQENVTLTTSQIPAHSHPQTGASTATASDPTGAVPAVWGDAEYSTATASGTLAVNAVASTGGSQPHNNLPPFLATSYIISLFGVFPSQS
jgi:microcystin-dependent protein